MYCTKPTLLGYNCYYLFCKGQRTAIEVGEKSLKTKAPMYGAFATHENTLA